MKLSNFSNYIRHSKYHETSTVDVTTRTGFFKLNTITVTKDIFSNGNTWRFVDTGEVIPEKLLNTTKYLYDWSEKFKDYEEISS